ncbi:MAG TPA: hypothetical protein VKD90_21500 [Gemmataceae bacterium]|nr:hypothetical protein [Gemmataceae bacterium]
MIRQILSLTVVAAVTIAVGAQGPEPRVRGMLYKMNRGVIERLVEQSVESSKTPNDHLKRADTYHKLLLDFNKQIASARTEGKTDRVAELTEHLTTLVEKGLAPTLDKAKRQVEGGSNQDEFPTVKRNLVAQLDVLIKQLPDEPAARASLEGAKDKVNAITIPEKK